MRSILIIFLPYLGVILYLIIRGHTMNEHAIEAVQVRDAAARQYIQQAAGSGSGAAEEPARRADLKEKGVIDDAEFASLRAKIVS